MQKRLVTLPGRQAAEHRRGGGREMVSISWVESRTGPGVYNGRSIPCGSQRHTMCDAYGHEVGLASLPGAPFTDCHDAIAHELWRILMEAGVRVDVEPRGIFTTLIPTPVLLQPGPAPGAVSPELDVSDDVQC